MKEKGRELKRKSERYKTALTEMINTLREKYGKDAPFVVMPGYTDGEHNTSVSKANGDGTRPNIETPKDHGR